MSIFGNFIITAKTLVLAESTYVTNFDNFLLTENRDILSMKSTEFPRIEIDVRHATSEYISQRDLKWNLRFFFWGYIKRSTDSNIWTQEEFLDAWDFGVETCSLLRGILDYKQSYPEQLPNFEFIEGESELDVDCELIPGISTFLTYMDATFIKGDTDE